jgi:hypothetical protein
MRDAFWATCLDGLAGYDIESAEDEICSELDNIATLRKSAASTITQRLCCCKASVCFR